MNIRLLDCTLRDGGYVNDWRFGKHAIRTMKRRLESTGVDILELGFIKDEPRNDDRTVFSGMEQAAELIGEKKPGTQYAVMAEVVNPLPPEKIAPASPDGPDIVRVIVWKRMLKEGFEYCRSIAEKGYRLCVQPARTNQYSPKEFTDMLRLFGSLSPMAVYVVDSWGTMYADELLSYLRLADENLAPEVAAGYHGHNNMMQAFDAACAFARAGLERDIIIDASVYGMGRGAGNLNLEIFAKWMNDTMGKHYDLRPMVKIYDDYIKHIYQKTPWGYSIPYFISAKYNCNPNFSNDMQKKGISSSEIEKIISSIPDDERIIFTNEKSISAIGKHFKSIWKNKLCIVIITYNKPDVISVFLQDILPLSNYYGIDIIVYDSSTNNRTKNVVESYRHFNNVYYDFYDGVTNNMSIDEKVISAYTTYSDKYEYVWVTRDGLLINLNNVIYGIKDKILKQFDLIVVDAIRRDYRKNGNKTYNDCRKLFVDQCHQLTILGASIIKSTCIKEMIKTVPLDVQKNLGLWQPYAIFDYFSRKKFMAASWTGILWTQNSARGGKSFWHKHVLWQWGERWYSIITNLPDIYGPYKKQVLKFKLIDCRPFSVEFIANSRALGGISISSINKYKKYIPHVCDTPLWKFYAISLLPKRWAPVIVRKIQRTKDNYHHFLNKHIRKNKNPR